MKDLLWLEAKESVLHWLNDNEEKFASEGIVTEMLRNNESCLRLLFWLKKSLSEIIVQDQVFGPFRFVCFESRSLVTPADDRALLYFYYDEEGDSCSYKVRKRRLLLRTTIENCDNNMEDT